MIQLVLIQAKAALSLQVTNLQKSKEGVKEFYLKSLPELGWQITDENENKLSLKRAKMKNYKLSLPLKISNKL